MSMILLNYLITVHINLVITVSFGFSCHWSWHLESLALASALILESLGLDLGFQCLLTSLMLTSLCIPCHTAEQLLQFPANATFRSEL